MRHWVHFSRVAVLLLLLPSVLLSRGFAAESEIKIVPPASAAEVDNLLTQGHQFESQRRWADALVLYQNALREHPGDLMLEQKVQIARIHYDLGRRYADGSFRSSLVTLREHDALALYGEVLQKINAHYVQPPNWKYLIQRGAVALEIALSDPDFTSQNLRAVDSTRIAQLIAELRQLTASQVVRTREEAQAAVASVARLAYSRIGLTPPATILEYTCAATGGLDEYSTYLTNDQLSELYSQIEGNFVGLGIELKADDGALLIVNVITGSPAERSGIRPGDRIVSVGGQVTKDLTTDQAANLLQGEEGSLVTLEAVSPGQSPRQLVVRREHVEVPSVDDVKIIDAASGVAYLKLTCFQKTTTRDLDAALWKLHREGMRSLIIDLRGNPGGLLTSSVEVADKFIEHGTIVSTRGRDHREDFTYSAQRVGTWRVPLVVLIDGDSASASEIFAGAIRDHGRGKIVGVRSYGKGSVQGIFPLSTLGTGVRLTTAKFYSPTNQAYSGVGVKPDVQVQQTARPIDGQLPQAEDATLAAALQLARHNVAQR